MKKLYSLVLLIGVMMAFCVPAGAETVTYTVKSTTSVTTSGTAPTGSSATFKNTYSTQCQMTKNNSTTLTLSGFGGYKITGIVLSMKSNNKAGSGTFSATVGTATIAEISSATAFDSWYDNTGYSGSYKDVNVTLTNSNCAIGTSDVVTIQIACTVNSLYIQSYTITYERAATMYTVTLESAEGGTIKADKSSAAAGDKVTLSYTENEGYYFDSWTVYDNDLTEYTVTDNSFTMPAADVTVKGKFTACTKLDAPQNVKASDITTNSATLSWDAVTNAKEYSIYITDSESYKKSETTSSVSYAITGLSSETEYEVAVSAVGDGHHYCESSGADTKFTTQALLKYTITWSVPDGEQTTTVTQGEKVVLPTTTPTSCSLTYTQFVGWFTETAGTDSNPAATKPATQVTAETVPTGDATYYAVFSDGTGVTLWAENFTHFSAGKTPSAAGTGKGTTIYGNAKITYSQSDNNTKAYSEVLAGGTAPELLLSKNGKTWTISGIPANGATQMQLSFLSNKNSFDLTSSTNGISISGSGTSWTITNTTNSTFDLTLKNTGDANARIDNVSLVASSKYISSCCADAAVVTVTPADTEINLGEDGTATTTVHCTQADGGEGSWSYSVVPATATFDGTNFSATAAGEYTLYATYTENCGKSGKATVTVTKNPVFGTATIDKSEFAVSCGDTTSMNSAATISLGTNYNLTKTVTVTAPEGFVVSTNKTDRTKYAQSVTLTPTASGANIGKITGNVYVRAYSAIARAEGYNGNITIAGDEITTQTLEVSSTVTCTEYALLLNDRGTTTTAGNYYAGAEVPQPADPTGVCTEPYHYTFDGWAEATVNDGATTYTKVAFPYTMPKNGATLYAVYKYAVSGSNDFVIADADEDLFSGNEYILTGANSDAEYALTCTPSTSVTGKMTTAEVTVTEITEGDNTSYEIQNVTDKTIIWKLIGDKTNGYAFQNLSTGTYLTAASTATTSTGLSMAETATTVYKISHPDATEWPVEVKQTNGKFLSAYSYNSIVYFSDFRESTLVLYLYTRKYAFTSMPLCDCVYFTAPVVTVEATTATTASLSWTEIANANGYEYSFDQNTWTTATTTTADGTVNTTLTGLENSKDYSVYVRGKAADGEKNCAAVATVEFTTKDCDDVPTGLAATATATSVTVSWKCQATTATVRIYSDADATTEVISTTDATSPCVLSGLTQNTTYYYCVFADGTCSSATESFTTETNDISVVEWNQNEMIVNVNAEGDDVSVVIEGKTTHGDKSSNIADGLFFSKYFEANNNVKLLAIYNGTQQNCDLSNYSIYISQAKASESTGTKKWSTKIALSNYLESSDLILKPDSELILISYQDNNDIDAEILECAQKSSTSGYSKYHRIGPYINFSGNDAVALVNTTTNEFEDLIGAGTLVGGANLDSVISKTDFMDDPGWYIKNGTSIETGDSTALSTNRCLLIRKNSVKDGLNAVGKNQTDFVTFAEEWSGKQVPTNDESSIEIESSCEAFAYVGAFNYNNYYISYDSIGGLKEIQGNRNADGTYTIPVNRLDTFACTNIRLQVKHNGTVVATKEQRVPIMVVKSTDTQNDTLFITKHTEEECKTCDVVVRDEATLTHVTDGRNEFRNMYIYAGSRLSLPAGENFTLQTAHMHAKNDSVSYAIINNDNTTITINELVHVKRIDGKYWYPFALPYDCKIADIKEQCGIELGTYGVDWGIKYYDGEKRQKDGNSMTTFGEVSKYWTMMAADGTLKAHTGYIIGLFYDNENLMRSIYFTPAAASNYVENGDTKTTQVTNWPHNLTADARHHGWNFVGSPYISLFGSGSGNEGTDGVTDGTTDGTTDGATGGVTGGGILNSSLKMGYTQRDGTQADKEHVYVSIPDGGNTNTYTQALASATTLKPFTAYFVQAIDPTDGTSHQLDLTYSKNNRSLPSRVAMAETAADEPILVEMTLTGADTTKTNATMTDNAGVWMSNRYSTDYEIGDDLYKMYAESTKPQLYTTDAAGLRMAYLAVPDQATIPVGLYVPAAGAYTLSLNEAVSRLGAAQAVYLQHNGSVVADLMSDAYTINATQRGTVSGYALAIHRAPHTTTAIDNAEAPHAVFVDGQIVVSHLPADATVRVYDVLGHLCYNATATESAVEVPATVRGVYTIVVATESAQTVLKTLAY